MTVGMVVMTLALTGAAVLQISMERIGGLPFMEVQTYMWPFYVVRFWGGVLMVIGVVRFLLDVLALRPEPQPAQRAMPEHAVPAHV